MKNQVATRYAQALFDLADEEKKISEIYQELTEILSLINSNSELKDVLKSPFVTKEEKRNIADQIFEGSLSKTTRNFMMVLIDNNRTIDLSSITVAYKELLNNKHNIEEGVVITAIPLSEDKISELEHKLSAKYNKNIKLTNKIDESIIGGALVKIGNEEIDGTVKSRLDDLKSDLSRVIS
ncbi:F0F1 ATP synthase subunit delta [Peptostreptococcus equinus]|uniref:ATP synthase subunit delta n=1 Tax=Peptostreptococcus equinus TaxID=3003601 RepID=A0ABY7JNW8_9FIRM|nr:F0F1 ATP synthase subunit delta [Peptostreptococcus sp. CBA3647]WAW15071.1 F0F1 ATP synthase subunit delta [Peptostreptococcus sp. CBA3647]